MKQPDCVSIECIYNDKLRKGLCIGVSQNTHSYGKDVIRQCWVKQRPTPNMRCVTEMQVQMTPMEAVGVGVALIRSSIIGETMLKRLEATKQEANRNPREKENTQNSE